MEQPLLPAGGRGLSRVLKSVRRSGVRPEAQNLISHQKRCLRRRTNLTPEDAGRVLVEFGQDGLHPSRSKHFVHPPAVITVSPVEPPKALFRSISELGDGLASPLASLVIPRWPAFVDRDRSATNAALHSELVGVFDRTIALTELPNRVQICARDRSRIVGHRCENTSSRLLGLQVL